MDCLLLALLAWRILHENFAGEHYFWFDLRSRAERRRRGHKFQISNAATVNRKPEAISLMDRASEAQEKARSCNVCFLDWSRPIMGKITKNV